MVVDQGKDSFILLIDPEFALGHIKEDYLGFIRAEINEFFFLAHGRAELIGFNG